MREIGLILMGMILGALILLKSDKQSVHLLEGKLFKAGKDVAQAGPAYRHQLRWAAWVQVVSGFGLMALSIILWDEDGTTASWTSGMLAAVLCAWGIWGRVRSFLAADAQLAK